MKKVLVVDDQPQISKIINEILTKSGYETILAFNGEIGYQKALETKPDLIIMDIMMPVMSGFESAKKIKSNPETSKIPIIFLTAKGQEADKEEAERLGSHAFITKPFSPKQLLQMIQSIIGN
jgi:CheY-like chemotaxis protein